MNLSSNLNITESDLIKSCIAQDRRMQEELYNRFAPKMYGVCLRYTGNADDAQDVLQDGFVKIFRKLESFRGEGSFEGWIRRIFVNTAIEHFRRKNYMQPVTEREESVLEARTVSALDGLNEKDVLKIVQELSPGYRTVFNLYVVEGYSHKEIAAMLDITEGTSKSQLSRAKVILQEMIKKHIDRY